MANIIVVMAVLWYFLVANKPVESRFTNAAEVDYIEHIDKREAAAPEIKTRPYNMKWLDRIVRARKIEKLDNAKKLFTNWNMHRI